MRSDARLPARLRAGVLSLLLLLQPGASWPLPSAAFGLALTGEALAQSRSSGGYSRPSGGYSRPSFSRTPSFGGSRVSPRTPSTSGGYSRPSTAPRRPSTAPSGGSIWDRSYSRERSSDALERMRAQQDAIRRQREAPLPAPSQRPSTAEPRPSTGGGWGGGGWGGGTWGGQRPARTGGWYGDRGWSPPPYSMGQRSFGIWDGVFLWFLLNNLNRPGSTEFFRNHQDDPGYREWREAAERQAQNDPAIRERLQELDQDLAAGKDQPRDPNYLPPDVPADVALASGGGRTPSTGGGEDGFMWWIVLLGGVALFVFLTWRRRRRDPPAGGGTMGTARSAGEMLRHKISGEGYTPQHFRLGMTVTLDPTPFLLGAGHIKAQAPGGGADPNALTSVQAVGRIADGAVRANRLYLPDERSMFEVYESAPGEIEQCRFFSLIDQVTPADEAEWGAWLDPQQGMIGWPQFQTKDGKLYDRVWAPGSAMVPPRELAETVETVQGTRSVRHQAMLYAAPTGVAAPGPETEYILVETVEDGGRAWVEIRAGIDINPASLSIA